MSSISDGSLPILTKFSLEERGELVDVQPVWLLVHQEHPGGPARYIAALPCPARNNALGCCYHSLLPLKLLMSLLTAELCCCQVPMLPVCECLTILSECS